MNWIFENLAFGSEEANFVMVWVLLLPRSISTALPLRLIQGWDCSDSDLFVLCIYPKVLCICPKFHFTCQNFFVVAQNFFVFAQNFFEFAQKFFVFICPKYTICQFSVFFSLTVTLHWLTVGSSWIPYTTNFGTKSGARANEGQKCLYGSQAGDQWSLTTLKHFSDPPYNLFLSYNSLSLSKLPK